MRKIFHILILSFVLILLLNFSYGLCGITSDMIVISAEKNETGIFNIYIRSKVNDKWSAKEEISISEKQELHPTIVVTDEGNIIASWSQIDRGKGSIITRFYSFKASRWLSLQGLETKTVSDMAPTLALDSSGIIWLAFSGTGPDGDDIYISSRSEDSWSTPVQVNESDNSPDILPRFQYEADGGLQLVWKGFQDGKYTRFVSRLSEGNWSHEERVDSLSAKSPENINKRKILEIQEIKKNLHRGSQAAIWNLDTKFQVADKIIASGLE